MSDDDVKGEKEKRKVEKKKSTEYSKDITRERIKYPTWKTLSDRGDYVKGNVWDIKNRHKNTKSLSSVRLSGSVGSLRL